MQQTVGVGDGRPPRGSFRNGWPSLIFAALVIGAFIFAFSKRPLPDFPETQLQAHQLLINGLAQAGDHYLAGGAKGRILVNDAPTGEWSHAEVDVTHGSPVTRIVPVDEQHVFAVGHNLMILRSEDGGERWQNVHIDLETPEPLLDIAQTADGERLIAIGGFGQYMTSDDGGKSWQKHTVDAFRGSHLNDIVVADSGTILIAAERGLMLRSRDRGETWQALDLSYPGSMFGGMHLDGTRWLVFGMRGHAFVSDDDGDSWRGLDTGIEDSFFDGARLEDGRVVLVGSMQTVLVAEPGSWDFERAIPTKQGTFSTVLPVEGDRLLVGGEPGAHLVDLGAGTLTPAGGK